ncbi:MAG: hypothetical protein IPO32_19325 [Crocinitomicaceae bacterium]|nr:hypothetical protein [Crocinitomicaceae bacterium]
MHYKLQQNSNVHLYLRDINGKIIEQVDAGGTEFLRNIIWI